MSDRHAHFRMAALALGALVWACSLVSTEPPLVPGRAGEFPHDVHLSDAVGLSCVDCHVGALEENRAGMPPVSLCLLCHAGDDSGGGGAAAPLDPGDEFGEAPLDPEDEFGGETPLDPDAEFGQETPLDPDTEFGQEPQLDPDTELPRDPGADQESEGLPSLLAAFVLEGQETPTWTQATRASIEVVFSHRTHSGAGVSCLECHAGIDRSRAVDRSVFVPMAACVRCHEDRAVQDGGCRSCHPGVDGSWKPPSHDAHWELFHGRASRMPAVTTAQDCSLCHGPDLPARSCESCHLSMLPRDHTPFFRNTGHGILARFDRGRCQACHQEDACLQCHELTRPRSHVPGFGEPANQHCLSCHLGAGRNQNGCYVCHQDGAPSHDLAPVPPPTVPAHETANACMTCHASIQPPNHPVAGDGAWCRICHQ